MSGTLEIAVSACPLVRMKCFLLVMFVHTSYILYIHKRPRLQPGRLVHDETMQDQGAAMMAMARPSSSPRLSAMAMDAKKPCDRRGRLSPKRQVALSALESEHAWRCLLCKWRDHVRASAPPKSFSSQLAAAAGKGSWALVWVAREGKMPIL